MSQKLLKELKKKLPYHYATRIAEKSSQLSVRTVRGVFNGEVTNLQKVRETVTIARLVIKEMNEIQRLLKGTNKRRPSKKVK